MHHFQHTHSPRRSHGSTAHDCVIKSHWLAVSAQEKTLISGSGSGLPPIKSLDVSAIEMHQERSAADAAALRLHQVQHHLYGNRCVDRAAAGPKHLVTRIGSQWVGGSHRKSLG